MRLTLPIRDVLPATPRARIVRLDLEGHRFSYLAGHAVLIGPNGSESRWPYSIAAAPEDAARDGWLELLVGVDAGGETGHRLPLGRGVPLDVEGPVGAFTFPRDPKEQRFVFIAGGTGIAPLRAMLRHALAIPHREVGLVYSARTPEEFAFQDEMRALARDGRIELLQTVTRGGASQWEGGRGRIGRAELQPLIHDPATLCFVCGPVALVDDTRQLLEQLGISRDRIKIEEW